MPTLESKIIKTFQDRTEPDGGAGASEGRLLGLARRGATRLFKCFWGEDGSYYGEKFLPKEQDALPQSGLFWGTVTWAPPTKVWPDDTFKGFFRIVHVAGRVHVNDIAAHWVYASAERGFHACDTLDIGSKILIT